MYLNIYIQAAIEKTIPLWSEKHFFCKYCTSKPKFILSSLRKTKNVRLCVYVSKTKFGKLYFNNIFFYKKKTQSEIFSNIALTIFITLHTTYNDKYKGECRFVLNIMNLKL